MVAPAVIAAGVQAVSGLAGGLLGANAAAKNAKFQQDLAKKGIRWKVEDAKAAGIHPLYALGAPTFSPGPIDTGGGALGASVANMGQDIGRAIDSTRTEGERTDARNTAYLALQLENQKLQNDSLRMDVASKVARLATNPAMPGTPTALPGQGNGKFIMGDNTPWSVDSRPTPAQNWENQYGEPGDWIGGGLNMINDAKRNLDSWFASQFGAAINNYTPDVVGKKFGAAARAALSRGNPWMSNKSGW